MMFLIRVAFWLSIVVLLLPAGETQSSEKGPGAAEAFTAAGAAVADLGQFCTRQPGVCTVGSQAVVAFGHKAQASAKLVYDFFTEKLGRDDATPATAGTPPPPDGKGQNTLTAADRALPWQGPTPPRVEVARQAI
jgi:hypothetical protein